MGFKNITDLRGIEHMTGLTFLNLSGCHVTDIAPLSGLTGLTTLALAGNAVPDLTSLTALTALNVLTIGECPVTDLTPLTGMTALTNLDAAYCDIVSAWPLAALTSLQSLSLRQNHVYDADPIASLPNLSYIDLSYNNIKRIDAFVTANILGSGDALYLDDNPLGGPASCVDADTLDARGVNVSGEPFCFNPTYNDTCDTAIEVYLPSTTPGTNVGAGGLALASCSFSDDYDVWFKFTSPVTSTILIDTCGSNFYTSLSVFDACFGNQLACDTGSCGFQSSLILSAVTGTTYYIRVAGYTVPTGAYTLHVTPACGVFDVVTFPDPALERVVRGAIGRPEGDLYPNDLCKMTELNAVAEGISDLTGIEALGNLVYLDVRLNDIDDLSPASSLTSLQYLSAASNQISDLHPLSGMVNLISFMGDSNNISSLEGLESLGALKILSLGTNHIVSLAPLANCINLLNLQVESNDISDLSPLANLSLLENLIVDFNALTGLETLPTLPGLNAVRADMNPMSSLGNLQSQPSLTNLSVEFNAISTVPSLAALSALNTLFLGGNPITDLSGVAAATALIKIDLTASTATDLSPLQMLPLLDVNVAYSSVNDIGPLVLNSTFTGSSAYLDVTNAALGPEAMCTDIVALQTRGVNVYGATPCHVVTENDACPDAIPLTTGIAQYGDSTSSSGADLSSCGTTDTNDVWFEY